MPEVVNTVVTAAWMKSLRQFLYEAFTEDEFGIPLYDFLNKFDYYKVQEDQDYKSQVFNFLLKPEGEIGTWALHVVAREALREKAARNDLESLKRTLEAELPPDKPEAPGPPRVETPAPPPSAGGQRGMRPRRYRPTSSGC